MTGHDQFYSCIIFIINQPIMILQHVKSNRVRQWTILDCHPNKYGFALIDLFCLVAELLDMLLDSTTSLSYTGVVLVAGNTTLYNNWFVVAI